MRVIGVLAEIGTQLGIKMDEVAIVPVATGMKMFNRSSLFSNTRESAITKRFRWGV